MYIKQLRLENFRNLATQEVEFNSGINLILGENGSGKTSLLEAIFFLGRAKSFRSSKYRELIQYQQQFFRIIAKTFDEKQNSHQIGMERNNEDNLVLRIDRESQKTTANLVRLLPVIAITSQSFALIDSGPLYRRQFIDYGCFHFADGFYHAYLHYQKALKNRNSALKQRMPKNVIQSFDEVLAKYGEEVHNYRANYFASLKKNLTKQLEFLSFPEEITINYRSGWNVEHSLLESLNKHYDYDYRLSHTRYGPHRADINLVTNKGQVLQFLSRGQQKILVFALYLAQMDLIKLATGYTPILIIDDVSAELDPLRREQVLDYLQLIHCQVFLSTTENSLFSNQNGAITNVGGFSMKKGSINQIKL